MSPASQPPSRPKLAPTAVVAGLGALVITSCGSTTTSSTGDDPAAGLHVTYELTSTGGGELNYDMWDVLTDGGAKVRETIGDLSTKEEAGRRVSDGTHAVEFGAADNGGFGAGSSYADGKVSDVQHYVLRDGDASLAAWCADAKPAGTAQVLGRSARHYTCRDPGIQQPERAKELWLDQQTGLILKWEDGSETTATAIVIDVHVKLPADAFSLQPAPGATPEKSP